MKQKSKVREISEYAKSPCISMVFPFGALAPDGRESGHQGHSRGQRFDPAYLHQIESKALEENPEIARFQDFFSLFILKLFGVSGAVFSPRLG